MPFEAKALRVQLPCGSVTVMEAEAYDAEILARQYWRGLVGTIAAECGACSNCSNVTDRCIGRSEAGLADIICAGTDPVNFKTVVDARVLPVLQKQLEKQLMEIKSAQEAVAKKMGSSDRR